MSLRLETSVGTPLVRATLLVTLLVTLLAAAVLALLPSAAGAQTEDKSAPSMVVRPGDSLWSISEGRLGPNAAPQRVANAAERLYSLNRGRIGADPGLIFVGQELLLPPALSEGPTGASAAPKRARESAHAADAGERDRAAEGTTGEAPKPVPETALGGADAKGGEAPQTAAPQEAQPVGLPALPDVAVDAGVPAVRAVASDGSPTWSVTSLLRTARAEAASAASALAESFFALSADARADGRRLLGAGVLALTLLAAVLLALKLPMRRAIREDAERWGTPSGYYGNHGETPEAYRAAVFSPSGRPPLPDPPEGPQAPKRKPAASGPVARPGAAATPSRRRVGTPKGRPVPRSGLALGAHNPEVRRAPRRARATMRARRLRPRLRQGRGVSARGGR